MSPVGGATVVWFPLSTGPGAISTESMVVKHCFRARGERCGALMLGIYIGVVVSLNGIMVFCLGRVR